MRSLKDFDISTRFNDPRTNSPTNTRRLGNATAQRSNLSNSRERNYAPFFNNTTSEKYAYATSKPAYSTAPLRSHLYPRN